MATFQSQINILAAGQHKLHKKIDDLNDLKLYATYGESNTIISDSVGDDRITIDGLGFKAYDCILTLDGNDTLTEIHLMGYDGFCEDFSIGQNVNSISSATIVFVGDDNNIQADFTSDQSSSTLTLTSPKFKNKPYKIPKVITLTSLFKSGSSEAITEGIKE